jgi:hypothetical protein
MNTSNEYEREGMLNLFWPFSLLYVTSQEKKTKPLPKRSNLFDLDAIRIKEEKKEEEKKTEDINKTSTSSTLKATAAEFKPNSFTLVKNEEYPYSMIDIIFNRKLERVEAGKKMSMTELCALIKHELNITIVSTKQIEAVEVIEAACKLLNLRMTNYLKDDAILCYASIETYVHY